MNKYFEETELLFCLALMLSEKIDLPIQVLLMDFTNFSESVAYVSKQLGISIETTILDCVEICKEITK